MSKKGVFDLYEMKRAGQKITRLTACDYPTATFEEGVGVDMILVGDSLGLCVYGYPGRALTEYVADVRVGAFPAEEHCYHTFEGEAEKFAAWTRGVR
jgi:ketopantoate hydroxymethyltransferase